MLKQRFNNDSPQRVDSYLDSTVIFVLRNSNHNRIKILELSQGSTFSKGLLSLKYFLLSCIRKAFSLLFQSQNVQNSHNKIALQRVSLSIFFRGPCPQIPLRASAFSCCWLPQSKSCSVVPGHAIL